MISMGVALENINEKSLGDYKLLKYFGRGGFGSVYLAEHRFLKKQFAIKVLNPTLSADSHFVERLEKEVAPLSELNHPSIVKLHNIGYAEGRYFLIMDPIVDDDGQCCNLFNYLNLNKHLDESQIEEILSQVASAIDYAHFFKKEGGIVHHSLKLSNIFIKNEDKIKVFVSDFGLTRLIGEGRALLKIYEDTLKEFAAESEKIPSTFLQSYYFLSPEQKRGNVSEIDEKSDAFAFGVLAYYLLTGSFPEGYFSLPSQFLENRERNWDWLICKCMQNEKQKRSGSLMEVMKKLRGDNSKCDASILSWEEVGKKVGNAMQFSFAFLAAESTIENNLHAKNIAHSPLIQPSEIARPAFDPDPGAIFHKESHISTYRPEVIAVTEITPLLTEMVVIPGGTYLRGSSGETRDEEPRHSVILRDFAIDIHPVTNEQFIRFLEVMAGEKDANNNDIIRLRDSRIKRSAGKLLIEAGYAKHPVVGVTWYGAYAYAKWIGKRLPTEAEWEIASSGKEGGIYPTGDDIDHTNANFFSSDTTAVKSYPPNSFSLYDMAGNVYEWCDDWYAYNYYETSLQEPDNPKGPLQGVYRVLRGGCWKSLKEDMRCSHRHRNNPGAVNSTYGFRCAADAT